MSSTSTPEVIDLTKDDQPVAIPSPRVSEPSLGSPPQSRDNGEGTHSVIRTALAFAPSPAIFGVPVYSWAHEFLRAWANNTRDGGMPPAPPPKDIVAPRMFYRLYSENEAIRSKHYITPDDQSLARINADTIPPPHTAAALRRFLCAQEGFDPDHSVLFLKRSDTEPAMDAEFISVLKGVGPGSSSNQPLALIVKVDKENPAPRFRIRAKEKCRGGSILKVFRPADECFPGTAPKGYLSYDEGEILLTDGIDDIPQGSIRLWKAQKSRGSGRIGLINPKRFEVL